MRQLNRIAEWQIRVTMTPARATLGGALLGGLLAVVVVTLPPDQWAWREFWALLIGLGVGCGVFGYVGYLTADPLRSARLYKIGSWAALVANLVLILVFPNFLRSIGARDPLMVSVFLGFIASVAFFATAIGFGVVDLVNAGWRLARGHGKLAAWQDERGRELDQDPPVARLRSRRR